MITPQELISLILEALKTREVWLDSKDIYAETSDLTDGLKLLVDFDTHRAKLKQLSRCLNQFKSENDNKTVREIVDSLLKDNN